LDDRWPDPEEHDRLNGVLLIMARAFMTTGLGTLKYVVARRVEY
jgi:hypothetical protein